jgi:chromosomal replication initiation ATPase DnaA
MAAEARAIVDAAAEIYRMPAGSLFRVSRKAEIAEARHVAMWAIRNRLGWSLPATARVFDQAHTTALHAHLRIEAYAKRFTPIGRRALAVVSLLEHRTQ